MPAATPDSTPVSTDKPSQARSAQEVGAARWRLRNWRLRSKLLAVLLIPTVVALVLGGVQVTNEIDQAGRLARLATQAQLQGSVATLVHQMQRERDLTVRYVASTDNEKEDQVGVLDRQRKRVIDATEVLRNQLNEVGPSLDDDTRRSYVTVVQQLERLNRLRQVAGVTAYPESEILRNYTESIGALLDLGEIAGTQANDPELIRLQLAAVALGRAKEQVSRKRAILLDILQQKKFEPTQTRQILAADAELEAARNDFRKSATPEQRRQYDDTVTGLIVDVANDMQEAVLQLAAQPQAPQAAAFGNLATDRWDMAATLTINLTQRVESSLIDQLKADTAAAAAAVRASATTRSILVLAALALAVFLAMLVAYSLLRPLRTLRRTALEVADRKLPEAVERILAAPDPTAAAKTAIEPVPVHTREEVGQVARSFDAVHGEAVRLAVEQALLRDNVNAMFVNLSRRSQALVERQLSLIDRLEQDEQDPDQLSSLFELDHLATRMRRNSENLLVLAGTDLTRRLTRPVPVAEVVGAAVSEVEQYARVQVTAVPDLAVMGRAVNDVVHLVAELLDNATAFSDPNTKVTVRTARTRKGELAIEISDRGVGMPEQEITDYNQRLADPPEVDVAVSRRMGLFVVGRLAQRHDIRVRLRNNEDIEGGTTALVVVPAELIQALGSPSAGRTSAGSLFTQSHTGSQPPVPSPYQQTAASVINTGEHQSLFTSTSAPAEQSQPSLPPVPPVAEPEQPAEVSGPVADSGDHPDLTVQVLTGRGEQDPAAPPELSAPRDIFQPVVPPAPQPEPVPEPEPEPVAEQTQAGRNPIVPRASVTPPAYGALNGTGERPKGVEYDLDAPTERLPIYEAVLSQWFQAVDSEPVGGAAPYLGSDRGDLGLGPVPPVKSSAAAQAARPEPKTEQVRRPEPRTEQVRAPEPPRPAEPQRPAEPPRPVEPQRAVEPERPAERSAPQPAVPVAKVEPEAEPAPQRRPAVERPAARLQDETVTARRPSTDWHSPGDEGWQQAEAVLSSAKALSQQTPSGLPKRVPKAHLVPGSAAPRQQTLPSKTPASGRSADNVRGRMSSFQQGLRRGRHARIDVLTNESAQGPNDDETRSNGQARNEEQP
ncbi:nitrate- and nitrite sensing domain-containing protein [Crossiella sp. CA-258035]|uniref:sensor histidine kinase n=1 Tax=Crossiella sp. CA-258035 TaxID=2981138 RepID=UPI0024BC0856|nr:nitrate- and nitrite sensing domain-containing protein [Crossiella sp. CA-258035]WHT19977.1 nitrate- and nitrite sensing domain-containing protein [Crossiella sp. CA-258035]